MWLCAGSSRTVSRRYIADFVSRKNRMRASAGGLCTSCVVPSGTINMPAVSEVIEVCGISTLSTPFRIQLSFSCPAYINRRHGHTCGVCTSAAFMAPPECTSFLLNPQWRLSEETLSKRMRPLAMPFSCRLRQNTSHRSTNSETYCSASAYLPGRCNSAQDLPLGTPRITGVTMVCAYAAFVCASATGMALGPLLALLLGGAPSVTAGPLTFDRITLAAWIMTAAWLAFIIAWAALFKDPLEEWVPAPPPGCNPHLVSVDQLEN